MAVYCHIGVVASLVVHVAATTRRRNGGHSVFMATGFLSDNTTVSLIRFCSREKSRGSLFVMQVGRRTRT